VQVKLTAELRSATRKVCYFWGLLLWGLLVLGSASLGSVTHGMQFN